MNRKQSKYVDEYKGIRCTTKNEKDMRYVPAIPLKNKFKLFIQ